MVIIYFSLSCAVIKTYAGICDINNQERIYRKHLRLKIVNRGKGIATDCKAIVPNVTCFPTVI